MEGWYRRLITISLIHVSLPTRSQEYLLVSWLQQAYHAATVIRQMQRLALNSGQQQQQEDTGSIGPSSGNPTQYREQSQISYNQHTGPLGPSSPASSNLSNWSRRASRHRRCSLCRAWLGVYESHFSLHSSHSRRPLATAIHAQQMLQAVGQHTHRSVHSLSRHCVAT